MGVKCIGAMRVMLVLAVGAVKAPAALIILDATDVGFVTEAGGSAKGDGTVTSSSTYSYAAGRDGHFTNGALGSAEGPMSLKNYFVFDLTSLSDTITSATLKLYAGTYESVSPSETFSVRQIVDQVGALGYADALAGGLFATEFDQPSDPLVGIADALYDQIPGAGPGPAVLASFVISSNENATTISIILNSAGIAHLNSNLGTRVILGGHVSTVSGTNSPQQVFGSTGPDIPGDDLLTPTLELTLVPEPSMVVLLGAGVLLLLVRRRRQGVRPQRG